QCRFPTPINCRETALPSPDFGNIHNSDATGFDIKTDCTTAQFSTFCLIVKFCNNFFGKSSLSAIGLLSQHRDRHSQPALGNESNPCGAGISPAQSGQ
ncbi:hypothetical protein, partial [Microcoleus sp. herbarium7]|uniref:hypothetical protein n=1 Tax=Microcoleus sp. herbarium7 TaxID=3055435 RepID=UPI002FCF77BB